MSGPAQKKQSLINRVFWFGVGGGFSSGLNTGVMRLLCDGLHWPKAAALGVSIPVTAVVFFLWSYFINFRTSQVWKDCLHRYLACVVACQLTNYLVSLTCIRIWGTNWTKIYFINVGVMSITGGIKFLLYHFWVFPHGRDETLVPATPPAFFEAD